MAAETGTGEVWAGSSTQRLGRPGVPQVHTLTQSDMVTFMLCPVICKIEACLSVTFIKGTTLFCYLFSYIGVVWKSYHFCVSICFLHPVSPVTSPRRTWRRRECWTPPTSESCWRASGSSNNSSSSRNKLYQTGLWLVQTGLVTTPIPRGQISAELNWTELERANWCQTVPSERNCTPFVLSKNKTKQHLSNHHPFFTCTVCVLLKRWPYLMRIISVLRASLHNPWLQT